MRRHELLEYNVPSNVQNYLDNVYTAVPETGGFLQRAVERGYRDGGRRAAEYVASVLADRLGEDEVLVRINGRAVFVSRTQEDNEPTVTVVEDLPNLEERLFALAEKQLLPQYFVDRWYTEEDETTVYYRAAEIQRNMRRGANVEVGPITAEPVAPAETPAAAAPVTTQSDINVTPLPPTGADTPLIRFSRSNQGGIANNPEEEEAILELQQFLNARLGLDVGRNGPDSKYGPRTTQAVRTFQQLANSVDGINITVDGDAGSETINALVSIRSDLETIDRLTQELENERPNESFVKIQYKSSIAKLLEKTLFEDAKSDLEALIAKYSDLVNSPDLPADSPIRNVIDNAEAAILGQDARSAIGRTRGFTPNVGVEDLKLPVPDEGEQQIQATNEYNALIDDGKFEEAANALRDDERLGVAPEGLEDELRRRAALTAPAAAEPAAAPEETPAIDPAETNTVEYGNDLTDNLRIYVTQTQRSAVDTEEFLLSIVPELMTNEQRGQARAILQPMIVKLMRGDRIFRIDGVDVQGTESSREVTAPSADILRNFIQTELQDVAQSRSVDAEPAPQPAVNSEDSERIARRLYDLLDAGPLGYTTESRQRQIIALIQTIQSKQQFDQVDNFFKGYGRSRESIQQWLSSEMWNVDLITAHLRSIGVPIISRLQDSIIHSLERLNTVLGVKR